MLTSAEAAQRLNCSVSTIRKLVLRGELASAKIGTRVGQRGGKHLIPEGAIDQWLNVNVSFA